jgi:shikimate kinase
MIRHPFKPRRPRIEHLIDPVKSALGRRSLVLVGLMGCGKTSVGRRLSAALQLRFVDADEEIELAHQNKSVADIFTEYGEQYFREGERRVIARILNQGPVVLATGGGAYMNKTTQDNVRRGGVSIWLKAELPVLMKRVMRRDNRPLLRTGDPEATMRRLMTERYPVYAGADLTVESREVPHDEMVAYILRGLLEGPFKPAAPEPSPPSPPSGPKPGPSAGGAAAQIEQKSTS